ncbi:MAG: hypothetical protein HYY06_02615 [Deltaproteobacteria bacterium]|nr:hypothetical protein [Deltaproteobacteria bacterium]
MRAIFVGAGRRKRLMPLTEECPTGLADILLDEACCKLASEVAAARILHVRHGGKA